MACAAAKNVQTVMVLRFFIGLAEATAYPGGIWLLGAWYNKSGKRQLVEVISDLSQSSPSEQCCSQARPLRVQCSQVIWCVKIGI